MPRADTELPDPVRLSVFVRAVPARPRPVTLAGTAYTREEWQAIMTVLRGQVRRCRDRITAGRQVLAAHRRGQGDPGGLGAALEVFDRTGTMPARGDRQGWAPVRAAGGVLAAASMLC